MDLYKDWTRHISQILQDNGYCLSERDADSAVFYYFDFLFKRILERKRVVHLSDSFDCPSDQKSGWDSLKRRIECGENINCYLSKGAVNAKAIDPMLSEWGVRHFHLGEKIEGAEFVERTGPLAYAIVRDDAVYVIGILPHGQWTNISLIEIIHRNWPYLIERHQPKLMRDINAEGNQEEVNASRKFMAPTIIRVSDGTEYLFGEMSLSGHNLYVIEVNGHMMRFFAQLQARALKLLEADYSSINAEPRLEIRGSNYFITFNETGVELDVTKDVSDQISRCEAIVKQAET